jgi:primase-polymerase (primpol)-like protein
MNHHINPTNEKAPFAEQLQHDQVLEVAIRQPKFENFPEELKYFDHWVVWKGKKIPYDSTRLNSKANVNDPNSWVSFNQADAAYHEGGWLGVGIDKCVVDGIPKLAAIQLLADMGAAYIDYSLSGNGLRTFEFANQSITGVRRQLDDWLRAKVNAGTKK